MRCYYTAEQLLQKEKKTQGGEDRQRGTVGNILKLKSIGRPQHLGRACSRLAVPRMAQKLHIPLL
jgi:hypothetical protein